MKLKRTQFPKVDIMMAPMIDIIFLLLIFFLLTSSFVFQPGIKINLPKAVTSEVIPEKNLTVIITSDNLIYLNNKLITTNELKEALRKAAGDNRSILIKSDKKASVGKVVQIWDMCRDLGISQVSVATNQGGD